MAQLHGQDALRYLSHGGTDWLIAQAVNRKAEELALEKKKSEIKALGREIAGEISRLFRA